MYVLACDGNYLICFLVSCLNILSASWSAPTKSLCTELSGPNDIMGLCEQYALPLLLCEASILEAMALASGFTALFEA
jgi:hypothetical protein